MIQLRQPNKTCTIIFLEYRLPSKIVSDTGTLFISEKSEDFTGDLAYVT